MINPKFFEAQECLTGRHACLTSNFEYHAWCIPSTCYYLCCINHITCVASRVSAASPLHMVPRLIVPSSWTSTWDTSLVSSSSPSSKFEVSNLVKSSFVSVSIAGVSGTSLELLSSLATLLDPNKSNYDKNYIISFWLMGAYLSHIMQKNFSKLWSTQIGGIRMVWGEGEKYETEWRKREVKNRNKKYIYTYCYLHPVVPPLSFCGLFYCVHSLYKILYFFYYQFWNET